MSNLEKAYIKILQFLQIPEAADMDAKEVIKEIFLGAFAISGIFITIYFAFALLP